jgi:hypothetical protein
MERSFRTTSSLDDASRQEADVTTAQTPTSSFKPESGELLCFTPAAAYPSETYETLSVHQI